MRRGQQAAQQDALGDVAYAGRWRGLALEPHLVAHFRPQSTATLFSHTGRQEARREPARLQHHDFTVSEHTTVAQYLWHLRGFPRACRGGEDETRLGRTRRNEVVSKSIDGQRGLCHENACTRKYGNLVL